MYININKLGKIALCELAKHHHEILDRAFYLRDLTDDEFQYQLDYACFIYNGKRNLSFIRESLKKLLQL